MTNQINLYRAVRPILATKRHKRGTGIVPLRKDAKSQSAAALLKIFTFATLRICAEIFSLLRTRILTCVNAVGSDIVRNLSY